MGQQVVNGELGVSFPIAHGDADHIPVFQSHHTVELQRDGYPLVLAQAAVVVGLKERELVSLIEGVLLQIQTGRIDVGRADVGTLVQILLTHHRQHHRFPAVHPVDLVSGLELHAPLVGPEAGVLRQGHCPLHALPLRLTSVQKLLVTGAVGLQGLHLLGIHAVIAVLLIVAQGTAQLLAPGQFFFLIHWKNLLCAFIVCVPVKSILPTSWPEAQILPPGHNHYIRYGRSLR